MAIRPARVKTILKTLDPSEIDDFRNETLNFLLPIVSIIGFAWGLARGYLPMVHLLWPPFGIFLLGMLLLFLRRLNPRRVSFLLAVGVSWILLAITFYWLQPEMAYFTLPVVTLTCLLLDFSGSLSFMLQLTVTMAILTYLRTQGLWLAVVLNGPMICAWLTWLVARLGVAPYLSSLRAARADREWALEQYESGKDYQSELRQALKQLESANYQINKQNRALEEARFEAEQARKAKNEFAAMVSHELLTPINLIAGYSEMICKSPGAYGGQPLPSAYRADAWAIYHSAQHLRSLITDVLDMARLDTGKITLFKEVISAGELLNQVVEIAHDMVSQKGLQLAVDITDPACLELVDVKRIRQVWLNLIKNAIRFTEKGTIRLAIERDPHDNKVIHSVRDSGIGIHKEDIPRLFQPFEQLSSPLNRAQDGAGLGLALCKSFIEEHGGKIWVESQSGRGVQVFFSLDEFHPPSQAGGSESAHPWQ